MTANALNVPPDLPTVLAPMSRNDKIANVMKKIEAAAGEFAEVYSTCDASGGSSALASFLSHGRALKYIRHCRDLRPVQEMLWCYYALGSLTADRVSVERCIGVFENVLSLESQVASAASISLIDIPSAEFLFVDEVLYACDIAKYAARRGALPAEIGRKETLRVRLPYTLGALFAAARQLKGNSYISGEYRLTALKSLMFDLQAIE